MHSTACLAALCIEDGGPSIYLSPPHFCFLSSCSSLHVWCVSLPSALQHPHSIVVLASLRALCTLYSSSLYPLNSEVIFDNPLIIQQVVSLLAKPYPLCERAACLLSMVCQVRCVAMELLTGVCHFICVCVYACM